MGLPVKVPEELYARLKKEAEKEGIPIQAALVRLLLGPVREVEALREELARMQEALEERLAAQAAEVQALNVALASLQGEVRAMAARRPELPDHTHPAYAERTAVETLQTALAQRQREQDALASRLSALETRLKDMEGMKARVEKLEGQHDQLCSTFASWVPTWKKVATVERDVAQVRTDQMELARDLDHQDWLLKEARDELARVRGKLAELEKRLGRVESLSHRHLGQPLRRSPR